MTTDIIYIYVKAIVNLIRDTIVCLSDGLFLEKTRVKEKEDYLEKMEKFSMHAIQELYTMSK